MSGEQVLQALNAVAAAIAQQRQTQQQTAASGTAAAGVLDGSAGGAATAVRSLGRSFEGSSSAAPFRLTNDVAHRVGELDVCPVELEAMVDPVRIEHVDEEARGPNAQPHVLSREVAERWVAQDPQRRCPLCRSPIVNLVSDPATKSGLQAVIRSLAAESFHGGDNLAHKAIKLLDGKLLLAIGLHLPMEQTEKMMMQKNADDLTPLGLLEEMHPYSERKAFLKGLTHRSEFHGAPTIVYSPLSQVHGGSEIWCHERPVFCGSSFKGEDGSTYTTLWVAELPTDGDAEADEVEKRKRRNGYIEPLPLDDEFSDHLEELRRLMKEFPPEEQVEEAPTGVAAARAPAAGWKQVPAPPAAAAARGRPSCLGAARSSEAVGALAALGAEVVAGAGPAQAAAAASAEAPGADRADERRREEGRGELHRRFEEIFARDAGGAGRGRISVAMSSTARAGEVALSAVRTSDDAASPSAPIDIDALDDVQERTAYRPEQRFSGGAARLRPDEEDAAYRERHAYRPQVPSRGRGSAARYGAFGRGIGRGMGRGGGRGAEAQAPRETAERGEAIEDSDDDAPRGGAGAGDLRDGLDDADDVFHERHAYRPDLEARSRAPPLRYGWREIVGSAGRNARNGSGSEDGQEEPVRLRLEFSGIPGRGRGRGGGDGSARSSGAAAEPAAGSRGADAVANGDGGAGARGLLEDSGSDIDDFNLMPARRNAQARRRQQAFDADEDLMPQERPRWNDFGQVQVGGGGGNMRGLVGDRMGPGFRAGPRRGGTLGAGPGGGLGTAGRAVFGDDSGEDFEDQGARRLGVGALQRYAYNPMPMDRGPYAHRLGGSSLFEDRRPLQNSGLRARPQVLHQGNQQRGLVPWGSAVMLRRCPDTRSLAVRMQRTELCVCPVLRFKMPNRDGGAGSDAEIFEPVICVQRGKLSPKVFHGRTAARRGIWIGGTAHFDDFTVHGEHGATALIVFDPQTSQWRLFPGTASDLCVMAVAEHAQGEEGGGRALRRTITSEASASHDALERVPVRVGPQGILLPKLLETTVRLRQHGPRLDLVLEPVYVARRWSEAAGVTMPDAATSFEEAQRLREQVVLIMFRSTVGMTALVQQGAVMTDLSIGRGEACNLRFSDVLSISRSHCMLTLDDLDAEDAGAEPRLVVYDEGSLSGTSLIDANGMEREVGVGRRNAIKIEQGDSLRLGTEVTVRLTAVSRRLRLDDPDGLADFFDSVGEVGTAQTLRSEPRLSEAIVSFHLSAAPVNVGSGWPSSYEDRGSHYDEIPFRSSSDWEY